MQHFSNVAFLTASSIVLLCSGAADATSAIETCTGVQCVAVQCQKPFKFMSAKDAGTCCPLCWAENIDVPEDRSWAKGLSGGVGPNNNADPVLCRGVMCPPLGCPEFEQSFDGRCCTKCASAASNIGPAEFAKKYDDMKAAKEE
mmetsp:Transcript_68134/g.134489  ORF Transcript_68134/g.134489 Transcript_68134/m.134489 type:complete len:144 (-) Transcript_68134:182-613(-)